MSSRREPESAQISRRIDWRFLLPNPKLERVVCIGEESRELLNALQHFSESLTIISSATPGVTGKLFNLAVVHSLKAPAIAEACRLLEPGGYLYWEINRFCKPGFSGQAVTPGKDGRKSSRKIFSRFSHVRAYANYLKELEFTDIEIHWHRPGFRNRKEIIPLESPETLHYVFSRGQGGAAGKLKSLAGKALNALGLLPYLVSSFSLVARKEG